MTGAIAIGQGGPKPFVISVFNQKGGIGKTTTAVNLAVGLAAFGHTVLLVDLDSQSNATSSVRGPVPAALGAYDLILGSAGLDEAAIPSRFPGLWVCGGSDELAGVDLELATLDQPQRRLANAIGEATTPVEVIVVDCPPALGMLPVNALVASDMVILPVAPHPMARDGLHKAWHHIHEIRRNLNQKLEIGGILLTMTEEADTQSRLEHVITAEFSQRLLPMAIPRDQAIIDASDRDLPVVAADTEAPAAKAYLDLAQWVARRFPDSASREAALNRLAEWRAEAASIPRSSDQLGPNLPAGPWIGETEEEGAGLPAASGASAVRVSIMGVVALSVLVAAALAALNLF